ncbi:hypothetical protein F2P81_021391 [Scophthalmus maximus]|uniref:Uncharacterized protein n=1 Tax=Scophthalmus maximus TaxID=52904 RepID=A0A6A4S7S2_SCOMX|nr:hypothetical protein F2P81_021391 [Scophthalmus maximus]
MAIIENKPAVEFDTVFGRDDSVEVSAHRDHEAAHARVFKMIVIGDSNVGKTCLTYRFCGGTFLNNQEATIGVDFRERTLQLDGESIKGCHSGKEKALCGVTRKNKVISVLASATYYFKGEEP